MLVIDCDRGRVDTRNTQYEKKRNTKRWLKPVREVSRIAQAANQVRAINRENAYHGHTERITQNRARSKIPTRFPEAPLRCPLCCQLARTFRPIQTSCLAVPFFQVANANEIYEGYAIPYLPK